MATNQKWLEHRLTQGFGDSCVEWPFGKDRKGYGVIRWNRANRMVAHIALINSGKIRPEKPNNHSLHSCDNPPCFNPNHLSWGSNRDNTIQAISRGLRDTARGSQIGASKLVEDNIPIIFAIKPLGFSNKEIAEMFNVSRRTIDGIISRKFWKHVQVSV